MEKILKGVIGIVAVFSVLTVCAYNVLLGKEDTKSPVSSGEIDGTSNEYIIEQENQTVSNNVEAEIIYDSKKGIITITDGRNSISMADKNVGAHDVCYGKDGNINCYGLYYQRGGNTGYFYSLTEQEVIAQGFDTDNSSWSLNTSKVVWNESDICPKGYHIPTRDEWQQVINMYLGNKKEEKNREAQVHSLGGFYKVFKIPFAGYRMHDRAQLRRAGEGNSVYLRSSTRDGSKQAYYIDVDSFGLASIGSKVRTYGYPIRCFLDK